jgi:hypothetical protein
MISNAVTMAEIAGIMRQILVMHVLSVLHVEYIEQGFILFRLDSCTYY